MSAAAAVQGTVVFPSAEEAVHTAAAVLQLTGTSEANALLVARSLVLAEQMGHASHGLVRVLEYRELAEKGQVQAAAEPVVVERSGSTAVVDGNWGWGNLSARLAARTASDIATETGVGLVSVRNCNHAGRLGEWVERIAAEGMVGLGFLSCGPAVAAFGGLDRVLGTNPLAVAVPTADRPVVLDFATAAVAEGKVRVAARNGKQVPPGGVQTADGRPTTDPNDFYAGGAILPFGLHKGYALSVVIQLLGDALTGSRPSNPRFGETNGLVLLALAVDRLQDLDEFASIIEEDRDRILRSRPVDPAAPVLLPGDVEARTAAGQPAGRVAVAAPLWAELEALRVGDRSRS